MHIFDAMLPSGYQGPEISICSFDKYVKFENGEAKWHKVWKDLEEARGNLKAGLTLSRF